MWKLSLSAFPVSVILQFPWFPDLCFTGDETNGFPTGQELVAQVCKVCLHPSMVTSDHQISTVNKDDHVPLPKALRRRKPGVSDTKTPLTLFFKRVGCILLDAMWWSAISSRACTMVSGSRYITTCPGRRISELRSLWQSNLANLWNEMTDK